MAGELTALTQEEMVEALAAPPRILEDGRAECPACERVVQSRAALGPHYAAHRRAVGLAPKVTARPRSGLPKGLRVRCPRCPTVIMREALRRHLMQVHELDAAQAIRERDAAQAGSAMVPSVADEAMGALGPPPTVLSDLTAAEAITGILSAARTDGLIPVRLLPAAHDLIVHTDAVLSELRRLS